MTSTPEAPLRTRSRRMSRSLILGASLIAATLGAGWLYQHHFRWVAVAVPQDRHNAFHYERSLSTPQSLRQERKVLVNLRERSARLEASFIYDYTFDCLFERAEVRGATSYFSADGRGEVIRRYEDVGLAMAGSIGIRAVMREVCAQGLRDIEAQTDSVFGMWDFSVHHFLTCSSGVIPEQRTFLEKVRTRVRASRKTDDAWFYDTTGEIGGYELKLPVTQLTLGVCDKSGETACGWAAYTAVTIRLPVAEVRRRLYAYRRSGVDYTVEARTGEHRGTARPLLIADPKDKNLSHLVCDNGSL